jgi:hypothetical protein
MTVIRLRIDATVSSQLVINVSMSALLDVQNFGEDVRAAVFGSTLAPSLMPKGAGLGGRVAHNVVEGINQQAISAVYQNEQQRARQDVPTAALIRRGSYKVGSKLLIKIEPTTTNTKLADYIPNLIFDTFSLQGVNEVDAERYQLHETFEGEVLYLFGRRPRVWTMQGIVANGRRAPDRPAGIDMLLWTPKEEEDRLNLDTDFANRLLADWDDFYRGTKAVELRARTYIAYEDSITEATLLELTLTRNAQVPAAVSASLTYVVHQRAFLGQENRAGLTAPNLADLIAKTNTDTAFEDKVLAPDLDKAPVGAQEARRQKAVADAELKASQDKVQAATEEKTAVGTTLAEEQAALAKAKADKTAADTAFAKAALDMTHATTPEELADAQRREDEARQQADEAAKKALVAEARIGSMASQQTRVEKTLTTAVSKQEDAQVKSDVLTDVSRQTTPTGRTFKDW